MLCQPWLIKRYTWRIQTLSLSRKSAKVVWETEISDSWIWGPYMRGEGKAREWLVVSHAFVKQGKVKYLKGQRHEIFCFKPLKIKLESFRIFFLNHWDSPKSTCTTDINNNGGKFCHVPLVLLIPVAIGISDTDGIFATVAVDTDGK